MFTVSIPGLRERIKMGSLDITTERVKGNKAGVKALTLVPCEYFLSFKH
jgi:hypothetical protein